MREIMMDPTRIYNNVGLVVFADYYIFIQDETSIQGGEDHSKVLAPVGTKVGAIFYLLLDWIPINSFI